MNPAYGDLLPHPLCPLQGEPLSISWRRGLRGRGQNSLSITQIKITIDMTESTTTRTEYLTSRQVTSCERGDLVKRNLNFSPFLETATFCHPFKISLRIKMNNRTSMAILKPLKSFMSAKSFFKKTEVET